MMTLSPIFIFLLYIVLATSVVRANTTTKIVVAAEKSFQLYCGKWKNNGYLKYWDYQNTMSSQWRKFYNGIELQSNTGWRLCDNKTWSLCTENVRLDNSGLYKCSWHEISSETNALQIQNSVIIELIVLDSKPQCGINGEIFNEEENISLNCSLKYNYSTDFFPVLEWRLVGKQDVINNSVISNFTGNEVISTLQVLANIASHNVQYLCTFYFSDASFGQKLNASDNTCTSPHIKVKLSPRNVRISPTKKVFHPGEVVSCVADGYPDPTYEWKDLETRKVQKGPTLVITKSMVRDEVYTYECNASNVEKDTLKRIIFKVEERISIPTIISISLGVLSLLMIFAILTLARRFLKEWIVKILSKISSAKQVRHREDGPPTEGRSHNAIENRQYGVQAISNYSDNGLEHRVGTAHMGTVSRAKGGSRKLATEYRYHGADGTEYMEMNGFRTQSAERPLMQSPMFESVLYAKVDHTMQMHSASK